MSSVGSSGGTSPEPGFDLHQWQSTWASIEGDGGDDPAAALSRFAELLEEMLVANGYRVDDPVARQGDEPEVVLTYLSAREAAERAEVGDAARADVEAAIDDLRTIFETLTAERR